MASIQREVGGWWRCSRYVVVDGFSRPADDALLERYDPWEAYRVSRDEKEGLPPYQTLFTLLRQLNFDEKRQLKPESESALEAWCNKNGLFGILPQRFSLISQRGPTGKDGLPTFERSHVRKGAEWTTLPVAAGSLGALSLTRGRPWFISNPIQHGVRWGSLLVSTPRYSARKHLRLLPNSGPYGGV